MNSKVTTYALSSEKFRISSVTRDLYVLCYETYLPFPAYYSDNYTVETFSKLLITISSEGYVLRISE